jgi:hypothetical protein
VSCHAQSIYFRNEIVLYLTKHKETSLCALCRRGLKFWLDFKDRTSEFFEALVLIKSVNDGCVSAISEVKSQRRIQCSGGPFRMPVSFTAKNTSTFFLFVSWNRNVTICERHNTV